MAERRNFRGQPNVRNVIDQPSYRFRLFLMSEQNTINLMTRQNNIDSFIEDNPKVIIAETGLTMYNITSVNIDTVAGPNSNSTQNSSDLYEMTRTVGFDMTIKEPLGISFVDQLFYAARSLNIRNFQRMVYILELNFHGYDPVTGDYLNSIAPGTQPRSGGQNENYYYTKWRWPVTLTNMDINSEGGETTYEIKFVPAHNIGQEDTFWRLKESITRNDATNVRDVLDNYLEALRVREREEYGEQKNEYEFIIHPVPERFDFIGNPQNPGEWSLQQSGRSGFVEFSIPKETSINDFVTELFSHTNQGQKLAMKSSEDNQPGTEDKDSVVWRVYTETNMIGFDSDRDEYKWDIKWHIIPFKSTRSTLTRDEYDPQRRTRENELEKFDELVDEGRLVKRYDYIYTGNNLDVISIDLNFNTLWHIARSVYHDTYTYVNATTQDTVNDDENVFGNFLTNFNVLFNRNNTPFDLLSGPSPDIDNASNLDSESNKPKVRYMEDLSPEDIKENPGQMFIYRRERVRNMEGRNTRMSDIDDTLNPSLFHTVMNQLTAQQELLHLNITINGDPFWLGFSDLHNNKTEFLRNPSEFISMNDRNQSDDIQLMDDITSENYFYMDIKYPENFREDGTNINLSRSFAVSGVYSVVRVRSNFNSDGTFTQEIKAIRNRNVDINNMME